MDTSEIIAAYDAGEITVSHALVLIENLVGERSVEAVLSELPIDWRDKVIAHFRERYDNDTPETEFFILEGVTVADADAYHADLQARTERMRRIIRSIRAWLRS